MARRGRRFGRYRSRGFAGGQEPGLHLMTVDSVVPDTRNINLQCVTVTEPKLISAEGPRLWEVVVGDETGVVQLHLDEQQSNIANALKPGIAVTLRSCQVKMLNRRYLAISPDAHGTVDVSPMKFYFRPNTSVNISSYEYKYVED